MTNKRMVVKKQFLKEQFLKVPLLNIRYKKDGIEILDAASVVKEQGETQITLDPDLNEKSPKWRKNCREEATFCRLGEVNR